MQISLLDPGIILTSWTNEKDKSPMSLTAKVVLNTWPMDWQRVEGWMVNERD